MGWKTLKQALRIDHHIVQVTQEGICIGSSYVHNLVTIDPNTGVAKENPTFAGFMQEKYPELYQASPEAILHHLKTEDIFESSITVYTYEGDHIIEEQCETPGWPNVTHAGHIMHDNTYSTDKHQVIAWAKRSARIGVSAYRDQEKYFLNKLAETRELLEREKERERNLNARYPDVPAGE